MALRGTLTHRKNRRLAQILGIQLPGALGYVEALLHVTAEHAPTGNIGRLSNRDIAEEMFYTLDPDELIAAFVASEWLERRPDGSLWWTEDWMHWVNFRTSKSKRRWARIRQAGGEVTAALRAYVLRRDDNRCLFCQRTDNLTIDHKIPVSRGGKTHALNLQTLCRPCNSSKKDKVLYADTEAVARVTI